MWRFQHKLLQIVAVILINLSISLAANTNLLTELGKHMDVSCSDQKCDRNVNERLVRIIENSMNMDADPCEDFYSYACGNWTKTSKYSSAFEDQEESFTEIFVDIFEKWRDQVKEGKELKLNAAYEKALNYYSSCVKESMFTVNNIVSNFEPAPKQKWPIFENRSSLPWNFDNFVWWKVLAKLQSYDLTNVLLTVKIDTEQTKRLRYAVTISNPNPDKTIKEINDGITYGIGKLSHVQHRLYRSKILAFEKLLNKVSVGEEAIAENKQSPEEETENADETYKESSENASSENKEDEEENPTIYLTLSELQTELPGIDWREYFGILLQGDTITLPNDKIFKIKDEDKASILRIINFLNESSKETVSLYLLAYFVEHVAQHLPVLISKKYCASLLRSLMPLAIDHIYEDNYYGAIREESDAVIRSVFQRLQLKLHDLIESNSIDLTETEVEYLQHKIKNMGLIIGNLPNNKTIDFLEEYYTTVNITNTTNVYHNHLELLHHKQLLTYRMLNAYHENAKNVYESFDPLMGFASTASPYNARTRNIIVLPFAYLRMPAYHHKLHDVFQFAELGFTTGHEIMHGFDESGLVYDANGNLNDIGIGIVEKTGFVKKLECLKKEPSASIDERIADVAGIRLVIEALFNDRTSKARKFHTQSTSLTNRQLFFVKLSQYFCQVVDEKAADLSGLSHDLSNVRVVYTMSNTREFAHEFKCDINTSLKLENVCQLW